MREDWKEEELKFDVELTCEYGAKWINFREKLIAQAKLDKLEDWEKCCDNPKGTLKLYCYDCSMKSLAKARLDLIKEYDEYFKQGNQSIADVLEFFRIKEQEIKGEQDE